MKQTLLTLLAFTLCLCSTQVSAQNNNDAKEETILICKKGSKQTVIELKKGEVYINGEKVTGNDNRAARTESRSSYTENETRAQYTPANNNNQYASNTQYASGGDVSGDATQFVQLMGLFINPRESKGGAYVERVNPYTPAAKMGLQRGDLITDLDNNTVSSSRDFIALMRGYQSGNKILVTFLREDRKYRSFSVLTNKAYNDQMTTVAPPAVTTLVNNESGRGTTVIRSMNKLESKFGSGGTNERRTGNGSGLGNGMANNRFINDYSFESANKMGLIVEDRSLGRGVRVLDVLPHSAADEAGMQRGDVIVQFNNAKITSLEDLQTILNDYKPNDRVRVHYMHNGDKVQTDLTLQKQVAIKDL
jgi:C-terminal processing protease CtpA/Prc